MNEFTLKYQIDTFDHLLSHINESESFAKHEKKYMVKRGRAHQAYDRIQYIKRNQFISF